MPPSRFFDIMSPSLLKISGPINDQMYLAEADAIESIRELPFLSQILDNSLLVSIHPARDQIHHEVKR